MKYIKPLLVSALCAALLLGTTSCQLSKLLPEKTEDPATTTVASDATTTATAATEPVEPMDLASLDLSQYVTLGTYKGLTADETVTPLTDETFEEELTAFINSVTVYEDITDRATAKDDFILMDYEGKMDGVPFEGGTAKGATLELNENSGFIDGFADGLIGVMPGTTVDLNLTFPQDYYEHLAGKAVVFTVTVHAIRGEKIEPALSDDYIAKATNGDYTTVEAFRTYYRSYLEEAATAEAHDNALNTLWSAVYENSTFHSLPEQQVNYYISQYKAQYESYAAAYGMTYEAFAAAMGVTEESLKTQAETIAKQDLVFFALIKAENLTVTDEEYTAGLAKYAADAGATPADLEAYYGADYIRESLLWDEMMNLLYTNATITK